MKIEECRIQEMSTTTTFLRVKTKRKTTIFKNKNYFICQYAIIYLFEKIQLFRKQNLTFEWLVFNICFLFFKKVSIYLRSGNPKENKRWKVQSYVKMQN
jgi:hypothetical protein